MPAPVTEVFHIDTALSPNSPNNNATISIELQGHVVTNLFKIPVDLVGNNIECIRCGSIPGQINFRSTGGFQSSMIFDVRSGDGSSSISLHSYDGPYNSRIWADVTAPEGVFPLSLTTPFSYTLAPGDLGNGSFQNGTCPSGPCGGLRIETISLVNLSAASVQGPVAGAGIPGLLAALIALIARRRRRSQRRLLQAGIWR